MNEQQLQQIFAIQQAITAAATAAVINSLLNPQQAAAAAAGEQLNPLQALQQADQQQQSSNDIQDSSGNSRLSPSAGSPVPQVGTPTGNSLPNSADHNNRLQDLLLQLQLASSSPGAALNLNQQLSQQQQQAALAAALAASAANQQLGGPLCGSPPVAGGRQQSSVVAAAAAFLNSSNATSSNSSPHHSSSILNSQTSSPNKKLKTRHPHQQPPPPFPHNVRSTEATSKPHHHHHHHHHSMPKNHSSATLSSHHQQSTKTNTNTNNNNSSSSSSSSFLTNNVGLPRKLVRGQDVWLGRGAEQTRQILKCIVCGLSFRTLAEMVQHMKDTQHYTNIVSQEQITSWRQPDNSTEHFQKSSNKSSNNKIPHSQLQTLNDGQDEHLCEKFNDSDRDDSYSNDDDLGGHHNKLSSSQRLFNHQSRVHEIDTKSDSVENINLADPSIEHSRKANISKSSSQNSRPLTRSKRREHDTGSPNSIKKSNNVSRENSCSPTRSSSSPSQPQVQRQNSNSSINLLLKDLNEKIESDNDVVTDRMLSDRKRSESPTGVAKSSDSEPMDDERKQQEREEMRDGDVSDDAQDQSDEAQRGEEGLQRSEELKSDIGKERLKKLIDDAQGEDESDYDENHPDANHTDDNVDEQNSLETNESILSRLKSGQTGQKSSTGDPLSALETMVEKSFDPRMRPGVANGGILQRLGIDEEVCPPWQHINYANWYAAATYGHPMAAALLAAGLNMQTNGIKLSKNMSSKKSDD